MDMVHVKITILVTLLSASRSDVACVSVMDAERSTIELDSPSGPFVVAVPLD